MRLVQLYCLLGLLMLTGPVTAATDSAATDSAAIHKDRAIQLVEAFHIELLNMAALTDHAAREAAIQPAVETLFDVERIASVSIGRAWRGLDHYQQQNFVQLLTHLISATYAHRFTNREVSFEVQGAQAARRGVVVNGQLRAADGRVVRLDYFFQAGRVFNIAADGVSDLSLRRADYSQVIKASGVAALLAHIEQKINSARTQ